MKANVYKNVNISGNKLIYNIQSTTQSGALRSIKNIVKSMIGSGKYKSFKIKNIDVHTRKTSWDTIRPTMFIASVIFSK